MIEDNIFFGIIAYILTASVMLPLIYLVIKMFIDYLTAPFRKNSNVGNIPPSLFWMWFITHNKD
ncbi:hypothetical protein [uncultured Porphyromonas sp.]|jgi:hypothetical protein|uniref:hypothetical protein n=1 Tax=uncultured Porphyromonas sp. TaxID=159274 RepID=UPI002619F7DD|nr:hypothetical protein [uncultured Porphyromonas sp.]